jgi:hypothetical protein
MKKCIWYGILLAPLLLWIPLSYCVAWNVSSDLGYKIGMGIFFVALVVTPLWCKWLDASKTSERIYNILGLNDSDFK